MHRVVPLLTLLGSCLTPLEWRYVSSPRMPVDRCLEILKEILERDGFKIDIDNVDSGDLETAWKVRRSMGQSYREFVRIKVRQGEAGHNEVWVQGVKQNNENPSGPTNDPEKAHFGIEENCRETEFRVSELFKMRLKEEQE